MRNKVQDVPIQFRANGRLLAAARAKAERQGMSLSEMIRSILRSAVAEEGERQPAIKANGALGAATTEIVSKAARGDAVSQHWLFEDRMAAFSKYDSSSIEASVIAMEAVLFARLLASHGHAQDVQRLAGALCRAADTLRFQGCSEMGDFFMAEAVSLLEQLAESGNDLAAVCSQALIGGESPALAENVRTMRRRAEQAEEAA